MNLYSETDLLHLFTLHNAPRANLLEKFQQMIMKHLTSTRKSLQ